MGAEQAPLLPIARQYQICPSDPPALEGLPCRFVLAMGDVVVAQGAGAVGIGFRRPGGATVVFLAVSLVVIHPPVGRHRLCGLGEGKRS